MSVLATTGKVLGGVVLGVGLAITWNGQPDLQEVQEKAQSFKENAIVVIEQVKELEKVVIDKDVQIGDLEDVKNDLAGKVESLEQDKAELESIIEELNKENSEHGNKNGLYKKEIEKANKDADEHKEAMFDILDESIFE